MSAWQAAGSPCPMTPATGPSLCGCCGTTAETWPAKKAISRNFTGYDHWARPAHPWLCAACTWSYTDPALRDHPHLLTRTPPAITQTSLDTIANRLCQGPLTSDSALVVPLRPRRRHLLPHAAWGRISLDTATIPWTARDATLMSDYRWLRRQGFSATHITARAPDFTQLQRCPAQTRSQILSTWQRLHAWRCPDSPWLALASRITQETR